MTLQAASKTLMLLGQCVPCVKQQASKFKIKRLELDQNLLMVRIFNFVENAFTSFLPVLSEGGIRLCP